MTNRTIQFTGRGFGSSPATVTVTANGNEIYTGEVPTLDQPPPIRLSPADAVSLFTMSVPLDFTGTFPVSITVTSGYGVVLSEATANYNLILNPIYTPDDLTILMDPSRTNEGIAILQALANPPLKQPDIDLLMNPSTADSVCATILAEHNLSVKIRGGAGIYNSTFCDDDSRSNVMLDGNPARITNPRPPGYEGTWNRTIPSGSTLTFDFTIQHPGVE